MSEATAIVVHLVVGGYDATDEKAEALAATGRFAAAGANPDGTWELTSVAEEARDPADAVRELIGAATQAIPGLEVRYAFVEAIERPWPGWEECVLCGGGCEWCVDGYRPSGEVVNAAYSAARREFVRTTGWKTTDEAKDLVVTLALKGAVEAALVEAARRYKTGDHR